MFTRCKLLFMLLLTISTAQYSIAQEVHFIKVHFLYGSTPKKEFSDTEPKWFGGILGGHVGIETDSNKILSFVPQGTFHLVAKKENRHSAFAFHNAQGFYSILGGASDEVKKLIISIPVSAPQKQILDSIAISYLQQSPYDYALAGMRCAAAAYEILARLDILPAYDKTSTAKLVVYPAILRNKLLRMAVKQDWKIERAEGSPKRNWEKG